MKIINTMLPLVAAMALASCASYPDRYDGYDEIARSARMLENATEDYYEQVRGTPGYEVNNREAGVLAGEARDFNVQVRKEPNSYDLMRRDFGEVAEAYALAQNELATRRELHDNRGIVEDFRDVEVAFANLNNAIDYTASRYPDGYYDRDNDGRYDRDRDGYYDRDTAYDRPN